MRRVGGWLTQALSIIGVLVVAALILSTALGAIGRYAHLGGITWSFELVGILFLWTTAIGTVLAEAAGENVSIDGNTITSQRGPLFRFYHNLVLLTVAGAFVWSGVAMLARTAFVPTPVMRAPSFTAHAIIVFMGVSLAIVAVVRLVKAVR